MQVDADTSAAKQKVEKETKAFESKKVTAKVDADVEEAKGKVLGVFEIVDKESKKKRVITYLADDKEPKKKLVEIDQRAKNLKPTVAVNSDISQALANLKKIPRRIVTEHIIVQKVVQQKATGGPIGFAEGGSLRFERKSGRIPGYDPHDSDDVPALLTRGEFVIRRDAVAHYGDGLLWAINNKSIPKERLARFATGGLVLPQYPNRRSFGGGGSFGDGGSSGGERQRSERSPIDRLIEELYKKRDILVDIFNHSYDAVVDISDFPQLANAPWYKESQARAIVIHDSSYKMIESIESSAPVLKEDYNDLKEQIAQIEDSARGKVLSKSENEELKAKIKSIKEKIAQDVEKAKELKKRANDTIQKLQRMLLKNSMNNSTSTEESYFQFAKGGKVPGYGGGDRNLALLEDGEFVVRKEAVAHFGAGLFEKLNNLELPKFRWGGAVGKVADFGKKQPNEMVQINFRMPSGKNYKTQAPSEVAKALAMELKRLM